MLQPRDGSLIPLFVSVPAEAGHDLPFLTVPADVRHCDLDADLTTFTLRVHSTSRNFGGLHYFLKNKLFDVIARLIAQLFTGFVLAEPFPLGL
jgi:hypothetical protein